MLRATARRRGDSLVHDVEMDGHVVIVDEPERLGGSGTGPSPQELFAGGLASCTATTVELYARHRQWEIGEVVVEVDYDAHAWPKRFVVGVRIGAELSDDQRRRLEDVARRCAVRQTLESEVVFEETLRAGGEE